MDRLKDIEGKFDPQEWYEGYYLSTEDIKWLIEQAEKVERLEKELERLNRVKEICELDNERLTKIIRSIEKTK